jgi:hypothetical protein
VLQPFVALYQQHGDGIAIRVIGDVQAGGDQLAGQ